MRIKCAVCPDFDLCLPCFAAGAEVSPHRAHHAYRVVEELSFPLNHPDWGVGPATPCTGPPGSSLLQLPPPEACVTSLQQQQSPSPA